MVLNWFSWETIKIKFKKHISNKRKSSVAKYLIIVGTGSYTIIHKKSNIFTKKKKKKKSNMHQYVSIYVICYKMVVSTSYDASFPSSNLLLHQVRQLALLCFRWICHYKNAIGILTIYWPTLKWGAKKSISILPWNTGKKTCQDNGDMNSKF